MSKNKSLESCGTQDGGRRSNVKRLAFAAMALALAFVTSFIKIIDMPMGGSVTLLSMFFISLVGYWYGPAWGLISAFAYGLLQFAIDPYILSIPQVICDYFLAFTALGLSGLFFKFKPSLKIGPFIIDRLQLGYFVAVFGRFVFAVFSGWVFFGMYAPESFSSALVYSMVYNGAYLGLEALITLVVITAVTPFRKALNYIGRL